MNKYRTHANITKNDLMERYNISLAKINKSMKTGELPYHKIGKHSVRFSEENIQAYVRKVYQN